MLKQIHFIVLDVVGLCEIRFHRTDDFCVVCCLVSVLNIFRIGQLEERPDEVVVNFFFPYVSNP